MENLRDLVMAKFGQCSIATGPNGDEYLVACPLCTNVRSGYTKRKLSINFQLRGYKCWRCGESGNIWDLFEGALRGKELPERVDPGPVILPRSHEVAQPGNKLIPVEHLPPGHAVLQYLAGRGRLFTLDELAAVGTVFVEQGRVWGGSSDMWYNTTRTLLFPMVFENELRGWQSRLLFNPDDLTHNQRAALNVGTSEDGDWNFIPKYLTAPGFPRGEVFFNWDRAMQTDCLVVTEGVFDALAVGQAGIAALGKGLGVGQLRRLGQAGKPIILLLDPDAREAARTYMTELKGYTRAVYNVCLEGVKDPGDASTEEIWKQIKQHIKEVSND